MRKRTATSFLFSLFLLLGLSTAAGAQDDCPDSPQGCGVLPGPLPPAAAPPAKTPVPVVTESATTAVAGKQQLPVTGSDTAGIVLGGTVLLLAGGALVWRSNRAGA